MKKINAKWSSQEEEDGLVSSGTALVTPKKELTLTLAGKMKRECLKTTNFRGITGGRLSLV